MKTSIRTASLVGIATFALSASAAYGFKEYCEFYVNFVEMDNGRSVATSFFEHPKHPQAVNAYIDTLRKSGVTVITQQDLVRGVEIPPLKEGNALVFVFEENPDHAIRFHFPSPSVDLHTVEIDTRNQEDVVNTVHANYTARELDAHRIGNPHMEAIVDAYLAHYERLGVKME
ncbi:MAG: hypothetical protein GY788_28765 [bacterium]|nr:hypothetical protein [bacterium]